MAASMVKKNFPYLKQQVSAALGNSSVVVKFVCATLLTGYFLSFSEAAIPFITVTPGYVIPPNFRIWTFLTHCFIQFHIWHVAIDIVVVVLCGKLLEPLWGALELLIFFLVVNTGVAILTTFVYIFIYLPTRNVDYLFDTHIHGLAGFIGGFCVAVKQIMPDQILINSPFGKLRNKHIPLLLFTVTIFLRIVGALEGPYPIMYCTGIFVSWTYLRFYQKHSSGNKGDMADTFSFASFFPDVVAPFVAVFANTIFSGLVKIKICKKPQRRYDVSSPTTITISLPGTDPQDAERRRQVALKALNERLSKSESQTSWPEMEGEESPTKETESPLKEVKVDVHKADPVQPSLGGSTSQQQPAIPVPEFKETKQKTAEPES